MADAKISALTALVGSGVAVGDLVPVVDVSAGASGSKKMTFPEFLIGANTVAAVLAGAGVDTAADYILIYDASAGAVKKILVDELVIAMAP